MAGSPPARRLWPSVKEKSPKFIGWGSGEIGDLLLVAAVLASVIPTALIGRTFSLWGPVPDPIEIVLGVVTAATMPLRRRLAWPMIVAGVVCACVTGVVVPLTLAAYSMTAYNTVRRWQWVAAGMLVVYVAVDYVNPYTDENLYLCLIRGLMPVVLPALVGTWVCRYRGMVQELRAGVRAREECAAWRERRRIAGELHDTVTHAVTSMALNAGIIPDTDDRREIRRLAGTIEDKAVQALTELRELLTVLRSDEVPASAAGVAAIETLVSEARATGLRVGLRLDVPEEALSRSVQHASYRVVQEGLNNVRKHAPGADVHVSCGLRNGEVAVRVVNGRGAPAQEAAGRPAHYVESGYGLGGLRERVGLVGGRVEAAPTREGGFSLSAFIPCGSRRDEETRLRAGLADPSGPCW
ncbi:sensor histidine kinase [Microbispora corallina]|uniref:sensor histidine kinase n=1 Tax=Microbispora corallina TaxID=83302 RepID=UPI00194FB8CF|nr:histidine kinase [Microbispora corallina]